MNRRDFNNFQYIINLNDDDYDQWLSDATDEDLQYLQQLFDQRKVQLIEQQLDYIDKVAQVDQSAAEKILNKYMLYGNH